jgi:hypothetical protein
VVPESTPPCSERGICPIRYDVAAAKASSAVVPFKQASGPFNAGLNLRAFSNYLGNS